jgi:hypothetical protein
LPGGIAEWPAFVYRDSQFRQFLFALWSLDAPGPVGGPLDRPGCKGDLGAVGVFAGILPPEEAGPAPVDRLFHESGAQRIALDVACHGEKVNVLLNGKTLEAALIKMPITDLVIMLLPAPRVCHGQARHEGGELPVLRRAEQQMPVIGHDAVSKELDGNGRQGVGEDAFKGGKVFILAEDFAASDAAVEHVKDHSTGSDAGGTRHEGEDIAGRGHGQLIAPVPFFGSVFWVCPVFWVLGSKLITAIELLSLSNKRRSQGMEKYRQKQREVVEAKANLVEIDLLRGGERVLLCPPENIPPEYRTLYQVCVYRALKPSGYLIYRVPLRERLPIIRIPLREGDDDATLDLQAMIDKAYNNGAYDFIDYTVDPTSRLDVDDVAWADSLLKSVGKR